MVTAPAPMTLDINAIDHTFLAIEQLILPFLAPALPASVPILSLIETILKGAATVQAGGNMFSIMPTELRAVADAIEKLTPVVAVTPPPT